jgi:hypothetical protein
MSVPALTRQQVDAAEPLDFEQRRQQTPAAAPARAYPARSYTIECVSPAGYRIAISLNDIRLDALDDALAALLERGYMPAATPAAASATPVVTGGPPTCQYHGPMKESTARPGTWYCPKKMGDGSYCKEKA